jgi:aryl-alcohol dehydrogenase-like predicted oxidoreductase
MEYRNLGRTGVKVSPLCLGAMNFGMASTEEEGIAIIHQALDAGINFIDTANVYSRGVSETIVGKALQRGRDRVVLATKVYGRMSDDDPNAQWGTRRHIIAECDASLRRLGTDYIDLYQIHRPNHEYPIDETLRALDDLIRAGKVRYIGTSTFAAWQIVESLWVSKEYGLNRFVCEQPPYNLLDRRLEREILPMAQQYGIGLIPWSPLASGRLTGRYRRNEPAPEDSRLQRIIARSDKSLDDFITPQVFDVIDALAEIAVEKEITMSQLALAWVVRQPGVTSPIIGPRTAVHLADNLAALEVDFSDEERSRIDEIVPPGTFVHDYFASAEWGPSAHRW